MDKDEVEDLMGALLELRGQLRKLQWYGEVNRRGFIKITKKLDKKIPNATQQQRYLSFKVDPKPFATNYRLTQDLKTINDWLSALADINISENASSVQPTNSLRRVTSRSSMILRPAIFDAIDQAIRSNDGSSLAALLQKTESSEELNRTAFQKLLLNFLQHAILCRSRDSIDVLLPQIESLDEDDDLSKRNCIHRLVIALGRSKTVEANQQKVDERRQLANDTLNYIVPAESPMLLPPVYTNKEQDNVALLGKNDQSVKILTYLLDKLLPPQRSAICARDSYGRLPLHYAAQYGFVSVCEILIKHMQDWGLFDVSHGIDSTDWQDLEGNAPLHLSVMGGHPLTTKTLLRAENWCGDADEIVLARKHTSKSGAVLALATKANHVKIVKLLVEAGVDINYQDEQGETALHVAARFGHMDCAKAILEGSPTQKADTNLAEKHFGWTPLFIASVDGQVSIVELLIEAGADLDRPDLSGWTAQEHAALRGHLEIANRLAEVVTTSCSLDAENITNGSESSTVSSSLGETRSNGSSKELSAMHSIEPVKTFGHRYLTNESMVLVSLGSMDMRKNVQAVKLDDIPLADAHSTQLDTALSVVVSASGATGEPVIIDLPVQETISTDPMSFTTVDASKVKLLFDIVPTYAGSTDKVIGRAVALLSSIKPSVGSKRITLQGDMSVPIVAAATLDVIGTVNFNFLIITPFTHPNMTITENHTYWRTVSSTQVIGHRGECFLLYLARLVPPNNFQRAGPEYSCSQVIAARREYPSGKVTTL